MDESTSLRLEFRADISDENVYFDTDGDPMGNQLTAAAQMIYRF